MKLNITENIPNKIYWNYNTNNFSNENGKELKFIQMYKNISIHEYMLLYISNNKNYSKAVIIKFENKYNVLVFNNDYNIIEDISKCLTIEDLLLNEIEGFGCVFDYYNENYLRQIEKFLNKNRVNKSQILAYMYKNTDIIGIARNKLVRTR